MIDSKLGNYSFELNKDKAIDTKICIKVGEVYISVLEHCRKRKFRTFLHLTLISKNFMMSWFSDFVVVQIFILFWSSGIYI